MLLELPWDQWPCASGLSVVTPLERNFCERLTRWHFSDARRLPRRLFLGKLDGERKSGRGGKEKEWVDCVEKERADAGRDTAANPSREIKF